MAFVFFILVNIGQTFAESTEAPEASETPKISEETKTPEAAKTERPFRIGNGLGYAFLGYREETDLPLNRYLETLSFNMNCSIEKGRFLYTLNLGFLSGETDPIEMENNDIYYSNYQKEHTFIRYFFENAFDYKLWGNSAFPGYLGNTVRADLYYSTLSDSYYYSLTMLCSITVHLRQKWIIRNGSEFNFSISIPFFGYAIRPPYYGLSYAPLDSEERVTSFDNYTAIFGDLKYYHKVTDWFSVYFGLGFEFSRISFPQPRRDASLNMNSGIAFSF